MRHSASGLLVALLIPVSSVALQAQVFERCLEEAQTQVEMYWCAADRAERAEAEMASLYDRLRKDVREDRQPLLVDAQAAWLAYREQHCRLVGTAFEGGSMQREAFVMCKADLALQRKRALEEALEVWIVR